MMLVANNGRNLSRIIRKLKLLLLLCQLRGTRRLHLRWRGSFLHTAGGGLRGLDPAAGR